MDSGPETIDRPLVARSAERVLAETRSGARDMRGALRRPPQSEPRSKPIARVSVLIATYNRGAMLSECLASIMHQTLPPHQIIVIDDGSTDDTAARVARFFPRVQYLYQMNAGKATALNAAMQLVSGDFVWVFDDDDIALPASIADRVAAFDANPWADVVFSRHYWGASGHDGRIETRELASWPQYERTEILLALMRGCFTTLQGALARTASYRKIGPFKPDLLRSQDYDALVRLARSCNVLLLDRPTFVFRRHDGERGPKSIRHSEEIKAEHWARYDAMIGMALRRDLALGEYLTPPIVGPLTPEQTRDALFNRMSVMASKGLGPEFIEDAVAFAQACPDRAVNHLTAAERKQAITAVQERYFRLNVVPRPQQLSRANDLADRPIGQALLRAFARGLLGLAHWGTRSPREKWQICRVAMHFAWLGWGTRTAVTGVRRR